MRYFDKIGSSNNLPPLNSNEWNEGFLWKRVFVQVMHKKDAGILF